jgi:hypothetical protein
MASAAAKCHQQDRPRCDRSPQRSTTLASRRTPPRPWAYPTKKPRARQHQGVDRGRPRKACGRVPR